MQGIGLPILLVMNVLAELVEGWISAIEGYASKLCDE